MPVEKLLAQWVGKTEGYTNGRDRSFHFGSKEHHIWGMISHLGPQLAVACGLALAAKLSGEKKAVLVVSGEGGTSEGDFHEALNLASVWQLPVIFLIEQNGYAISTPNALQYACESLIDKAPGYGIDGLQIDGNNVCEVFETIGKVAESIRENPRPVLIEAITFRARGHEEATGNDYVPKELLENWIQKDPLINFEKYLIKEEFISLEASQHLKGKISAEIDQAISLADEYPEQIYSSVEA